uniref:Ubiquitin-like domain-containing protein n=2 Tax=Meloidogyne incognita group TaxID=654580 RepID=A0A914N8S4_MELIC
MVLINLPIKLIDREDASIIIDDQSTISQLRDKIAEETLIPRDDQRIIFRGKPLNDNSLKLINCGFEDKMAVHVVTRPIPQNNNPTSSSSTEQHQFPPNIQINYTAANQPHIVTQNVIYGQVPFERTQIFREPNNALTIVGGITETLRNIYRMETEHTLVTDLPRNNDFLINVTFRSIRQLIIDSSAYERFDNLKNAIKSLAWLFALIKSQIIDKVDLIIYGQELDIERQYRNIANILWVMHAFDACDEIQMNNLIQNERDIEICSLIEQLNNWQIPNDDDHIEHINNLHHPAVVRHCTSRDLSTILIILSIIEAKINEHLMNRYYQILALNHNLEDNSYTSRLLNYFCNGISRIHHMLGYIHSVISSFHLHLNQNQHNRLYPIYDQHRRIEEPLRAEISLLFSDASTNLPSQTATFRTQATQASRSNSLSRQQTRASGSSTLSSVINGFTHFAQQLMSRQNNDDISSSSERSSTNSNESQPNIPPRVPLPSDFFNPPSNLPPEIANHVHQLISQSIASSTGQQTSRPADPRPTPRNIMLVGISSQSTDHLLPNGQHLPNVPQPIIEVNQRDADFWNDPQTIALGLHPPPQLQPHQILHNRSLSGQRVPSIRGEQIANMFNERIRVRPQSNANGEAVFNELDQFALFVRQTLESIVNCMVQHDSSILRDQSRPSSTSESGDSMDVNNSDVNSATSLPNNSTQEPFSSFTEPNYNNSGNN